MPPPASAAQMGRDVVGKRGAWNLGQTMGQKPFSCLCWRFLVWSGAFRMRQETDVFLIASSGQITSWLADCKLTPFSLLLIGSLGQSVVIVDLCFVFVSKHTSIMIIQEIIKCTQTALKLMSSNLLCNLKKLRHNSYAIKQTLQGTFPFCVQRTI